MRNNFFYATAFCLFIVAIVIIFRFMFPQNHSYGSLAAFIAAFAFALYLHPTIATIIASYFLFFMILIIDANTQWYFLTGPKSLESIVFPLIASLIQIAPLIVIWGARRIIK
ncbi:MAG: hypothetical protein OEZ58_20420 [Gammaproteobacteria bacterium]|nr:hypothetical protein [Gammaproteobacteria bacterium]